MSQSGMIAISGGTAVLPDQELKNSLILMEEGRLAYVGPREGREVPSHAEEVDATGRYVLPGLIDTHVHGTHGDDVMLHGEDGIRRISARFPEYGTTAWLPSTISARHPELMAAVRWCVAAQKDPGPGAEIVGLHVEGPYINVRRKGAQPAEGVRDPDMAEVEELFQAAEGQMRVMTLAPELPGALHLIRELVRRGVIASLGHTDATFEEAIAGIKAGASHATHLFNAMRLMHHRDPGVITACLNDPRVLAEIIPDGVHVDPQFVKLAYRMKGRDGLALITDAFSATGLPDGHHTLGPHRVLVQGPLCTLEDGTIAGSILTMDGAIRNAMTFSQAPLVDAVRMSSLVPARVAGCADRKGSLEVGKDADVTLFSRELRVVSTWVGGRRLFG